MSLPFTPAIDIIMGPMYCGKSTEILRRLIIYHEMEMKVLYINTVLDTRAPTAFSTHNKTIGSIPFDAVKVTKLSDCDVDNYEILGLDEAQFFPDLKEMVLEWVEKRGKIVIVAGLNGDFRRQPFGHIIDLIPYADSVLKLTPFCMMCKKGGNVIKPAHFTKRTVSDNAEILIGGKEAYVPVCRECFLK